MCNPSTLIEVSSADGDWVAVYAEGCIRAEGHTISLSELCHNLGIQYRYQEVDNEWLEEVGRFPMLYENIPQGVFK